MKKTKYNIADAALILLDRSRACGLRHFDQSCLILTEWTIDRLKIVIDHGKSPYYGGNVTRRRYSVEIAGRGNVEITSVPYNNKVSVAISCSRREHPREVTEDTIRRGVEG